MLHSKTSIKTEHSKAPYIRIRHKRIHPKIRNQKIYHLKYVRVDNAIFSHQNLAMQLEQVLRILFRKWKIKKKKNLWRALEKFNLKLELNLTRKGRSLVLLARKRNKYHVVQIEFKNNNNQRQWNQIHLLLVLQELVVLTIRLPNKLIQAIRLLLIWKRLAYHLFKRNP